VRQILRENNDGTGITESWWSGSGGPSKTGLLPAYPNLFNASSTVPYILERSGPVRLDLADTLGWIVRSIISQNMIAGSHVLHFDANGLPSGVYFFILKAEGLDLSRKILLAR
jgi:hypothetical protein